VHEVCRQAAQRREQHSNKVYLQKTHTCVGLLCYEGHSINSRTDVLIL